MASYKTPPTVEPALDQEIKAMVATFSNNAPLIAEKLLSKGLKNAGVTTPKISLKAIIQMIEQLLVPVVHKFEGGWSDHPNDKGGATMRGVILTTLVDSFDKIFIDTGIPQVSSAAKAWNSKHGGWKKDAELGKKLLYILAGDTKVGGLFIYQFLASKSNRYPIAIMTEDPFLGYFLVECCWGTGAGVYRPKYADFDGLGKKFGWNGQDDSWPSFIAGLGDRTPEVATQAVVYRFNHIMRISKPESTNGIFRKGWLNRLLNDEDSHIMMMVKINEVFNQNSNGLFKLTADETAHLQRKAAIYKTIEIDLPG